MSKKLQGREKTGSSESKGKRKRKKEFCLLSLSLSLLSSSPRLSFWLLNYRNGASPPSPPASPLSRRGRGRGRSTCCCGRGCSCSLTRGASRPRSIEKKEKNPLFFKFEAPRRMQQERRVLSCFASSFAPSRRSRRHKAAVSRLAQQTQRTVLSSSSERLVVVFGAAARAIIKMFASHTTRTRARSRPRPRAFNNSPEAREIKLAENSIRAER